MLSHTSGIPGGASEYYSVEQIDRQFVIDVLGLEKEFHVSAHEGYAAVKSALDMLATLQKRRKESPSDDIDRDISHSQHQVLVSLKSFSSSFPADQHSRFNEAIGRLEASLKFREEAVANPIPSLDAILQGKDKTLGPIQVVNTPGEHFEYSRGFCKTRLKDEFSLNEKIRKKTHWKIQLLIYCEVQNTSHKYTRRG